MRSCCLQVSAGVCKPQVRDQAVQCELSIFTYDKSRQWQDTKFKYFTGISRQAFNIILKLVGSEEAKTMKYRTTERTPQRQRYSSLSAAEKLFLTLVRLRRGFSLANMSTICSLPEATIGNIFNAWMTTLANIFRSMQHAIFVSAAAQAKNKSDCFEPFPNLRVIVDTTDIKINKPSNMEQQSNTFSSYKASNVLKVLVGISVYGGLSFIGPCFEGNLSDRQVFLRSGIMDFLNEGEAVMCDRGFDVEEDLNEKGVDILIPAFLGDREQFTEREILVSKAIAGARIHVETFIGRMKFYKLIRHLISYHMIDMADNIVTVIANLVNFDDPFICWNAVQKAVSKAKKAKKKL